ncbi:hypothetical protein D8S78_22905 [Natrialba swarupiae]|nr:hypothetical protein [Natrialba swarupiae]
MRRKKPNYAAHGRLYWLGTGRDRRQRDHRSDRNSSDRRRRPSRRRLPKQTNVAGGWTISGVGTSVSLSATRDRIDSARVGLAAVGQTGASAPTVETALEGTPTTMQEITKSVEQLGADIEPTTTLVTSQYRLQVAKTLASRSIAEAVTRAGGELE